MIFKHFEVYWIISWVKFEPRTPDASAKNKQRLNFADFDDSSVELISLLIRDGIGENNCAV